MSTSLNADQILALAPDTAVAKAANKLATPRSWVALGQGEGLVWGECKGSAKEPYRVQADLSDVGVRCSCPSRKQPCKHALGLLLLLASAPATLATAAPPDWVAEWQAARGASARRKAERQVRKTEDDPEAQRRRERAQSKAASARADKVAAGLDELRRWLRDQLRQGLAGLQQQGHRPFDTMAARLIDAQAPGIARRLRAMAGIAASGGGWQGRLLERLALLHLLIEAYGRIDTLPAETQEDVRAAIGFTRNQAELLAGEGQRDRWLVLGQQVEDEDQLTVQRSWLWGERSGRPALILDFATAGQPLDRSLPPGSALDAELVFFASAAPLRALIKQRLGPPARAERLPALSIAEALASHAGALARNPWLELWPLAIGPATLARSQEGGWLLRDEAGGWLPLAHNFDAGWQLLAVSGGHPLTLAGSWDGRALAPLCAWAGDRLLTLDRRPDGR
jgi:hypothetical protein